MLFRSKVEYLLVYRRTASHIAVYEIFRIVYGEYIVGGSFNEFGGEKWCIEVEYTVVVSFVDTVCGVAKP